MQLHSFAEIPTEHIEYIEARNEKRSFSDYKIDLETAFFTIDHAIRTGDTEGYAPQIPLKEDIHAPLIFKALTVFLTACDIQPTDLQPNLALAKQLAERFEITELIDSQWFVRQSNTLFDFLDRKFSITNIARRYPIRGHHNGRLFETEISILLENVAGSLIVILESSASDVKKVQSEGASFILRFCLVKKALLSIFGEKKVLGYVHFPLLGTMIELS